MKKVISSLLIASLTIVFAMVVDAQINFTLNPLASFGGNSDGSIRPGEQFFDTLFNQRGMAYDPASQNLVLVDTHTGSGGNGGNLTNESAIYILDGTTGGNLGTLSTNGIGGGAYALAPAAVDDDGVVYICNQINNSTNAGTPFKIYRWDSVFSALAPVVAFSGTIAPSQRYGTSIDIRGAGTDTQIIIGSLANSAGQTGTNVVIFTTADGVNFTANVLATDVTSPNFNDGIAFGVGNTFWAKRIGAPLRYMSFDLGTMTAVTLASYTNIYPKFANLGPISVDNVNKLLAAIEVAGGTVSGGPERVWLFDISDPSKPPVLLSIRTFVPNNQNTTAPAGFLDFGNGRLYAHVSNNGLLASMVDSETTPLPIINQQPPTTNRVAVGLTARFEVLAYPNITGYQWRTNGTAIPGATNYFLEVPNVQLADSGRVYSVAVSNAFGTVISSNSVLSVVNPADLFHLNRLWSASPGSTNYYVGTGGGVPTERTIAYNALSNQLYVVFRSASTVRISVVDPDTGQFLYLLKTNGIVLGASGGNIPLCGIAVAADGAIYACNSVLANDPGNLFKIYRWANSGPDTSPDIIFGTPSSAASANPAQGVTTAGFRWGDNLDVRGSGTGTQIIVDHQETASFRFAGLLRPTDSTMMNWSSKGFVLQNNLGGAGIGRSLQFGVGDTFWQKRWAATGAPLVQSSFAPNDPDPVLAPVLLSSSGQPLFTNGPVGINFSLKLGAAINMLNGSATLSDTLELYDLTAPETPVLASRYNFPGNSIANGNHIGQVIFTDNYVFALDANNGILAFNLATGPLPPPTFLTQPKNQRLLQGGTGSLLATVDQIASFQWVKDNVNVPNATNTLLTFTSAQLTDAGNYWAVASNANGMATSLVANVAVELPEDNYSLAQIWAGTPNVQPYVTSDGGTSTPKERSIAYNALSNQLLVVRCALLGPSPNTFVPEVHVVDANTGMELYTLNVSGIFIGVESEVGGSNPLNLLGIAAADDGSIYACNMNPNASGGIVTPSDAKLFRVYRWANSDPNTVPSQVFAGDPANQTTANFRWGDTMTVRGSGANTEILLDSNDGGFAALLRPTDSSLSAFTNSWWSSAAGGGSIGRSLQFQANNTYWQKRKASGLKLSSYDANSQTSASLATYNNFPSTLGGVAVDTSLNLAAGVDFVGVTGSSPDAVGLYGISDFATPILIARYNFPANQTANANFISQTIIAGNKVFSLDGNNGILAFTIQAPVKPRLSIAREGSNVLISWRTDYVGWTLQCTTNLVPASWMDVAQSPGVVGANYVVTNAITTNMKFYRLIQ